MSVGVFTLDTRYTLVEKTAGEVGDGTAWPMLVTLDQVDEITLRVKDSKCTGSISETLDGVSVTFGFSGTPEPELVSEVSADDYDWFVRRGYSATEVDGYEGYFGEGYSVGGTEYFDIGDNERGILEPPVNISGMRTGFSHEFTVFSDGGLETDPLPSHYLCYNTVDGSISPGQAILELSGQVAWVDVTGSGNPYDPGNELWIGLSFDVFGTLYFSTSASTDVATAGNSVATGLNLEIEISSAVLTCPIYFSSADAESSFSGAIRIAATEWWPYAKPGGAVWNAGTGAKL
jgi:hypothetical protein